MSLRASGSAETDSRSDIYALGAVAYFMLTGHAPFESDKPLRVLFAHANDPVVPPSQHRPDIPADLEEVILRCLAKKPADRYQSAMALRHALRECDASGKWGRDDAARWWTSAGRGVVEPATT